jgi:hypothetical protein
VRIALVALLVSTIAQAVLADLAQGLRKRGLSMTLCAKVSSVVPSVRFEPVTVSENVHPADFSGPVRERAVDAGFFVVLQKRSFECDAASANHSSTVRKEKLWS